MLEVLINNERWTLTGQGDDQLLHYSHPEAPGAAVPMRSDVLHLLSMQDRRVVFVDVVEAVQ